MKPINSTGFKGNNCSLGSKQFFELCEEEIVVMLNNWQEIFVILTIIESLCVFSGSQLRNKFWFLVFGERINLKYPGNNLLEQSREPTN